MAEEMATGIGEPVTVGLMLLRRLLAFLASVLPVLWLTGAVMAQPVQQATDAVAGDMRLQQPLQGWNSRGMVDGSDRAVVSYPYSPVHRGAYRGRRVIRGQVPAVAAAQSNATAHAQPEKGKPRPATLVVNGNAMPLWVDEKGRFAKPYAFGHGSNSVEVRSADGRQVRRAQFLEQAADRPRARLRIICGWDDNAAEVDMHVITPDGQHATWSSPVLSNGGGFEPDTVDGPGPEMFVMTAPVRGLYQVYVNYWGNFDPSGYNFDEANRQRPVITTMVTLVFEENTANERRETFVVPLRKLGETTLVKQFRY